MKNKTAADLATLAKARTDIEGLDNTTAGGLPAASPEEASPAVNC
jgi:hypothetical protein